MSKTDQSKILYSPQKCIFSIARGVHKTDAVRNMSHFHFHEIHEIIYVASGIITYYVGKEAYILKPGDFFLIKKNLPHIKKSDKAYDNFVINFDDEFLQRYLSSEYGEEILSLFDQCHYKFDNSFSVNEMKLWLETLHNEYRACGEENISDSAFMLLTFILSKLRRNPSATHEANTPVSKISIDKIIKLIQIDFAYINKIEDIAEKFFVSKSHLSRIFKEHTGMSLMAYVNSVKINYAMHLLKTSDMPINKVSDSCGFLSSSYFIKCFKKNIGVSPKEFRKNSVDDIDMNV